MDCQILQARRKIIQEFVCEISEHWMDHNMYGRVEDNRVDLEFFQSIMFVA